MLEQCQAAAQPDDQVWFVDSASTDGSAAIAAEAGVAVVPAPLGKGNALAAAVSRWRDGWLIFVDADIEHSERSIPGALREAAAVSSAQMIVGTVDWQHRRSVGPYLYQPVVRALFPEVPFLPRPLSGFRALSPGLALGDLPSSYGVEVYLNVQVAVAGGRIEAPRLGTYQGPIRDYANIPQAARDIAVTLLDLAQAHGRIQERNPWEVWTERVLAVIDEQPREGADDAAYLRALQTAASEPLPPT